MNTSIPNGIDHKTIKHLLADIITFSDDPDTRIGCVVVDCAGYVVAHGTNRLAKGIQPLPERVTRPGKYNGWMIHAEGVMLCKAAKLGLSLDNATIYMNWFPCAICASLLVEAGFKRLVGDYDRYMERIDDPRYGFDISMQILREGNIEISWLELSPELSPELSE